MSSLEELYRVLPDADVVFGALNAETDPRRDWIPREEYL